eukprot:Sdes_comp17360_c0_seq1m6566
MQEEYEYPPTSDLLLDFSLPQESEPLHSPSSSTAPNARNSIKGKRAQSENSSGNLETNKPKKRKGAIKDTVPIKIVDLEAEPTSVVDSPVSCSHSLPSTSNPSKAYEIYDLTHEIDSYPVPDPEQTPRTALSERVARRMAQDSSFSPDYAQLPPSSSENLDAYLQFLERQEEQVKLDEQLAKELQNEYDSHSFKHLNRFHSSFSGDLHRNSLPHSRLESTERFSSSSLGTSLRRDLASSFMSSPISRRNIRGRRQLGRGLSTLNSGNPRSHHLRNFSLYASDEFDNLDYESLLELQESIGDVKTHGMTSSQIESLPSVPFDAQLSKADNSEISCAICMQDYVAKEEIKILPCFHSFHGSCVGRWLSMKGSCPVCRINL